MEPIAVLQSKLAPGEALLITGEDNRFYCTRFASSDGAVLITRDDACFFIDSRYVEKAKATVTACRVELSSRPTEEWNAFLRRHGCTTLYVETDSVTVEDFARYRTALEGVSLTDDNRFSEELRRLRAVKTPAEIALVRQAQALTDDTFRYILPRIEAGRTEKEILLDMEFYMRRQGSEGVSFDFIVVSGKNSSLPHGVATDKPVASGDFITMDFGAVVGGYRSDMTRTVAVGSVTAEQKRLYDTVLNAQLRSMDAVKPGVACCDVDAVARNIIDEAGYRGCFGHALGHSVGIAIHESPNFSPRCKTVLEPGMLLTAEPGIYVENTYGVRIEDMVLVTENGCEDLTNSPKDLLIL